MSMMLLAMSQLVNMFDPRINIGHCDLYFMGQ